MTAVAVVGHPDQPLLVINGHQFEAFACSFEISRDVLDVTTMGGPPAHVHGVSRVGVTMTLPWTVGLDAALKSADNVAVVVGNKFQPVLVSAWTMDVPAVDVATVEVRAVATGPMVLTAPANWKPKPKPQVLTPQSVKAPPKVTQPGRRAISLGGVPKKEA